MPESSREENERAACCKVNQERRGQHEPCGHCRSRRQSSANITIECTGFGGQHAFLEQQEHRLFCALKRGFARARTNKTTCGRILNAGGTKRPSAIHADGHGVNRVMADTFHSLFSLFMSQFRWCHSLAAFAASRTLDGSSRTLKSGLTWTKPMTPLELTTKTAGSGRIWLLLPVAASRSTL